MNSSDFLSGQVLHVPSICHFGIATVVKNQGGLRLGAPAMTVVGYGEPQTPWQALRKAPDYAITTVVLAPLRYNYSSTWHPL